MATAILFWHRRDIRLLWREPVFRHPILILESDDWGAGPLNQAEALDRLIPLLQRHRDETGHSAVLSLALVLAVPDGPRIEASGRFERLRLDAPPLRPVLAALTRGESLGVFALQLHGLEHFWPSAIMSSGDPRVQVWCRQAAIASTEELPSHLQSRWVDASVLPSSAHTPAAILQAVDEETAAYAEVFGSPPCVVVPPTFVWTTEVEDAWATRGVTWVVTPGCRYTARDQRGDVGGKEGSWFNGQRRGGTRYVVRTDYFEPKKGRNANHALAALARDAAQARPCILENHRDNFCRGKEASSHAENELESLLQRALAVHRNLRFLSTAELCAILDRCDQRWIATSPRDRLPVLLERLRRSGRLWKLMRLSGLAWLGAHAIQTLARMQPSPRTAGAG